MNKALTLVFAVAMVLSVATPAMAVAADDAPAIGDDVVVAQTETTDENDTDVNETDDNETATDEPSPGAMLAGSIGVHQAEMNGEIEARSFGHQVAAAATNDSKAEVLNLTHERVEERLSEIESEKAAVEAAYDNGTISESQYQARMTVLNAKTAQIERMTNETERTAGTLPNETLEANGVNVTAIHQLRDRAHNMSGPEVSQMARQIAGNHVGAPMGPPENVTRGPAAGMPGGSGDNATMGPGGNGPAGPQSNVTNGSQGDMPGGPHAGGSGPTEGGSGMNTSTTYADDSEGAPGSGNAGGPPSDTPGNTDA